MAWIAGLAIVALVLAGWRKTARAQPKRHAARRDPAPGAVRGRRPSPPAVPRRRPAAAGVGLVASGGLAVVIGAVIATVTAFGLA